MENKKMMSYRNWRKKLLKKHYSDTHPNREALPVNATAAPCLTTVEESDAPVYPERLNMLEFQHYRYEKEMRRLVRDLAETYYKERIFRDDRVQELKRKIQRGEYLVPGAEVVKKWFPEGEET